MCRDDAPTGKIFQAGNGRFSMAALYSNAGVNQGAEADFDSFLEAEAQILDMSTAQAGWWRRRGNGPG